MAFFRLRGVSKLKPFLEEDGRVQPFPRASVAVPEERDDRHLPVRMPVSAAILYLPHPHTERILREVGRYMRGLCAHRVS